MVSNHMGGNQMGVNQMALLHGTGTVRSALTPTGRADVAARRVAAAAAAPSSTSWSARRPSRRSTIERLIGRIVRMPWHHAPGRQLNRNRRWMTQWMTGGRIVRGGDFHDFFLS